MIPMLLWRCPLCHRDAALRHRAHWSRDDELKCRHCRSAWVVHRMIGGDFILTVTHGDASLVGQARPLAEWYDCMKAGFSLVPLDQPSVHLAPGEDLYLHSQQAKLMAEEANPLFDDWEKDEAPWEKPRDLSLSLIKAYGRGQLWLTSERFLWVGDGRTLTFRLSKVNSVYAEVHRYFCLLYGLQIYKFGFRGESILKWLTYTARVTKRLEQVTDHQVTISNY